MMRCSAGPSVVMPSPGTQANSASSRLRWLELVRLADDLLAAELASKRANVEQAQATLENAAAAYRRAQSLSVSGVLSQSDLDKLRSEELAAQHQLEVGKAELQTAELRMRHTANHCAGRLRYLRAW